MKSPKQTQSLSAFLRARAFVVLTCNARDPSPHGPFEAWAYRGPLEFSLAETVVFGAGQTPADALAALDGLLRSRESSFGRTNPKPLCIDDRERGTILAALRFHQDENLQGRRGIADLHLREIATDGGRLKPLNYDEVGRLCERLNCGADSASPTRFCIEPPPEEGDERTLFRVVYVIDVDADDLLGAARKAYGLMADPESQPPVLQVIDPQCGVASIDLSEDVPSPPQR